MDKYLNIFINDMRNTRRDPTLLVILFVPVMFIFLTRFGLTSLAEVWPVISEYYVLLVAFFCVLTAMMPGFIVSFILLDERDQNLLQAFRVMPVSASGFFGSRMIFMLFFGVFGCLGFLLFNGVVQVSFFKSLVISLVCASCSPMFVFLTVSFAKNKIEGATIMKVLNTLLMLPIVSFFLDHPLTYLIGIIPFFWVYEGFKLIENNTLFFLFMALAFALASIINYFLYRLALKRFFYN